MNILNMFRAKKRKGFTIIELLVVIIIIAILGTLTATQLLNKPDQARATAVVSEMNTLKSAINIYRLDTGLYPTALADLVTDPSVAGWDGPYVDVIPTDTAYGGTSTYSYIADASQPFGGTLEYVLEVSGLPNEVLADVSSEFEPTISQEYDSDTDGTDDGVQLLIYGE